jgi:hypothetical protein
MPIFPSSAVVATSDATGKVACVLTNRASPFVARTELHGDKIHGLVMMEFSMKSAQIMRV